MKQDTIAQVQQSWALVLPIAPQAAALFYAKLFVLDPQLKPMFKGDMQAQGMKLMQMIGAAVRMLDDLPKLVLVLQGLGRRHAGYGVMPAHYAVVGTALLQTLSEGLGATFTRATEQAWTEVYGVIAGTMIEAAADAPATA